MEIAQNNMPQGDMIPEELKDLMEQMREAKLAKIEEIGKLVSKKRDEAVKGRKQSGIEAIWEEDEEYYQGIDDANRDSHPWLKSASSTGGISREVTRSSTRCTSFFNITRQFVESASARMGDILLPAGDWNFAIKPSPVQDEVIEVADAMGTPLNPEEAPVNNAQMEADAKAEKGELKIRDWLVEGCYHTEVRKVIEESAKLGTGILKGPFPTKKVTRKASKSPDGNSTTLEMKISKDPVSKYVDAWDFFPDPSCGEDIHNGSYVFERDRLSAKKLKDLKGLSGYLPDQIDKVLEEGPNKRHYEGGVRQTTDKTKDDEKFEVWYFYGELEVVGITAMGVKVSESDASKDTLPAVVTMVNDTPIRAFINPLDSGEFPYDLMVWQRMAGMWAGIGVSRQARTAQDMLNASARALMDNAGLSSGPMLIIRKGSIIPADGRWEVTARKVWWATEQADIRSVADAIQAINIPMIQAELTAIIQLAYKMAEDATGIFFIMQGQQGAAPDTVGGMELLHRNASAILRRLARVFDERVTEPHIRRYYEWLLLYGPEDCKGDMNIEAIGSTSLVEREINSIESMALLQLSVNPAFGIDPESAMTEVLKSKRFIPEKWQLSDAKKKEMQSAQPPMIPAIEVAKIRAASEDKRLQVEAQFKGQTIQVEQQKTKTDMDRDLLYADTMARRDQTTQSIRMEELRLKREVSMAEREIKMLDYANQRNISLDQIKAGLAKESMKLRTQKELSGVVTQAPQVATPAVEPAQHAPDGEAFQQ